MNRDQLRAAMPTVAAIVDDYRAWLTDGGKVIYAEENRHVIDRREPVDPDQVFTIPPGYRKPVRDGKETR